MQKQINYWSIINVFIPWLGLLLSNSSSVSVDQGWPRVVYNPKANEFFAVFQFRSSAHFNGKYIIIGQRIQAAKTERAANPQLVVKGTSDGAMVDVTEPEILYNPAGAGKNQRSCVVVAYFTFINVI